MGDDTGQVRQTVVDVAVDDIRGIEAEEGITTRSVARIRDRLIEMAAHTEVFSFDDYPSPEGESCLYRISQDPDDRFALYVNSCNGARETPAHNHTTWAVVVGFEGQELNRFYDRSETGAPQFTHEHMVEAGTGVAMLPEDLHSIHLSGRALNFHMYGLALERLVDREYYSTKDETWKYFAGINSIREARAGQPVC